MAKKHILIVLVVVATLLAMVVPASAQAPYKFPAQGQPWKGVTLNASMVAE